VPDIEPIEGDANEDVEAHGVKQVAGVGLAAAALIGAGAALKVATDDSKPNQRIEGALVTDDPYASLKRADADGDGYVNYRELGHEGFKYSVGPLNEEGVDVTVEALSAAGVKVRLDDVLDKERGFELADNAIMLKRGVDKTLDEAVQGPALEWTKKFREIDRDGDGLASYDELQGASWKWSTDGLRKAGYEVTAEDLAKAGYKQPLETFGEGGFMTKEDLVMLELGVDHKLDDVLQKWRG
jgi:EF hand